MQVDEGQQQNNEGLRVRDSDEGRRRNTGHQKEDSIGVSKLQQAQQDLERERHQQEDKDNALQDASAFSASLRL